MRSRSRALLALTLLCCAINVAATWHRSLIPVGLDGTVSAVELRRQERPGRDDVSLLTVDGRTLHVDSAVGTHLVAGEPVRKAPLSTTLSTPGGPLPLRPSADALRMLLAMPLVAGIVVATLRRTRREA